MILVPIDPFNSNSTVVIVSVISVYKCSLPVQDFLDASFKQTVDINEMNNEHRIDRYFFKFTFF